MKIEIEEAANGWIIKANGESRREPKVFEFDGTNRFRTSLENIVDTAERALGCVLNEMIGSTNYRVVVDTVQEKANDHGPVVCSVSDLPDEALPGGLSASGPVDAREVQI